MPFDHVPAGHGAAKASLPAQKPPALQGSGVPVAPGHIFPAGYCALASATFAYLTALDGGAACAMAESLGARVRHPFDAAGPRDADRSPSPPSPLASPSARSARRPASRALGRRAGRARGTDGLLPLLIVSIPLLN